MPLARFDLPCAPFAPRDLDRTKEAVLEPVGGEPLDHGLSRLLPHSAGQTLVFQKDVGITSQLLRIVAEET